MPDTLGDQFFSAITRGDIASLREIYAPDARIWHNDRPDSEETVEENLRVLGWLAQNLHGFRYEDVRRQEVPDGFVQQHVVRGSLPDGVEVSIPACIFVRIAGGRVRRIEEYLDTRAAQPIVDYAARSRGTA